MSDTILSGLIEKALYPEAGSNWACRDWRTVSTLLDAAGEQASDAVIDLIGLLSDTAEAQQAEIARLTAENERLVAESISDMKSFEEQLAEAREAARKIWKSPPADTAASNSLLARWPWLEETNAADAAREG